MTLYLSDPGASGGKPPSRPPIWAAGPRRQAPSPRDMARASLLHGRTMGAPLVRAGAERLARLAGRVDEGSLRVNTARLGVLARLVPPAARVARGLRGSAALLAASAETVAAPPPLEALPLRPWEGAPGAQPQAAPSAPSAPAQTATTAARRQAAPAAPPHPVAAPPVAAPPAAERPAAARPAEDRPSADTPESERDTLDVIRSLMRTEARPSRPWRKAAADVLREPPAPPVRGPRGAEALPPLEPQEPTPPGLVFRATARTLGTLFLVLMLPAGAALTLWLALRGREILPET